MITAIVLGSILAGTILILVTGLIIAAAEISARQLDVRRGIRAVGGLTQLVHVPKEKIHVATFGTLGPPHDNGLALGLQLEAVRTRFTPYVHAVHIYSPKELPPGAWRVVPCDGSFPQTKVFCSAANHNFWRWKSALIKDALANRVPDGHYLVYTDSNFAKYPNMAMGIPDISTSIARALQCSGGNIGADMACFGHPNEYMIDQRLIERSPNLIGRPHVAAYRIVMKNTALTRELVERWDFLCSQPSVLQPDPDRSKSPLFYHTSDQAVFNLVAAEFRARGKLPRNWPNYTQYPPRSFGTHNILPGEPTRLMRMFFVAASPTIRFYQNKTSTGMFSPCKHAGPKQKKLITEVLPPGLRQRH